VSLSLSQELLWGGTEDLLIPVTQQQPAPDTPGTTTVLLTRPQRGCKAQDMG